MQQDRFILFSTYLNRAHKSLSRIKNKNMGKYGLGSGDTVCLYFLYDRSEGITKTELASLCGVDKALISRIIRNLIEKNYVMGLTPDQNYKQRYILTEEGTRIVSEIIQTVVDITDYVSGEIPKEQIDGFYATMNIICKKLEESEEKF